MVGATDFQSRVVLRHASVMGYPNEEKAYRTGIDTSFSTKSGSGTESDVNDASSGEILIVVSFQA